MTLFTTLACLAKVQTYRVADRKLTQVFNCCCSLFEQIKAEGYDGGYSQLTAFIRSWRDEQGKSLRAFVPLTFSLGEAFQFEGAKKVC